MSDTIREIIIKDFLSRLSEITISNGYNTDIGETISGEKEILRARRTIGPDELPACVLWPQPETSVSKYGQSTCTMTLKIEGIVKFLAENPSVVAEKILGDLKKCILSQYNATVSPPTGWNRSVYIDDIVYTGGGTDEYPDEGSVSVGAYINVNVTYTTKIDDPYSQ